MIKNLTKENFFNEMKEKYPQAMDVFCKWIDEYKKEVGWNKLFNDASIGTEPRVQYRWKLKAPKFHDLPFEMQNGIIARFELEYFNNHDGTGKEHYSAVATSYRSQIKNVFADLESQITKRGSKLN